jgi:hypothetical protein
MYATLLVIIETACGGAMEKTVVEPVVNTAILVHELPPSVVFAAKFSEPTIIALNSSTWDIA